MNQLFKGEKNMSIAKDTMHKKAGIIEYKMPKEVAKSYLALADYKGEDVNQYLCKIVNDEYNLRGLCVRVILF